MVFIEAGKIHDRNLPWFSWWNLASRSKRDSGVMERTRVKKDGATGARGRRLRTGKLPGMQRERSSGGQVKADTREELWKHDREDDAFNGVYYSCIVGCGALLGKGLLVD